VSDVAMGQVGAIFSLESSRLARSSKDWHRLLELCAITKTLVFDGDGCYDPADFNDSLVLGMKGTFAQAELHIIRARLHGGKLNKAQKGSCVFLYRLVWYSMATRSFSTPTRRCKALYGRSSTCLSRRAPLRCGSTLPSARTSVSAPVIRRCLEWQAYLGPVDPFATSRRSSQSILRRRLRIWVATNLAKQIGSAGEIYTRSRPMQRSSGALSLLITTQAILHGSNSSLIEDGWQRTGPTTKFLPGLLAKACVCFRACCFAAFAGIV